MSILIRTNLILFCGCCLLGVAPSRSVAAADGLNLELTALAQDIHKLIDKRGGGVVAVGGFTAASNVQGSSGPAIQLQLAAAFQKAGQSVNADDYQYEVTGNYLGVTDKETQVFGVKIVARVTDSDGTTLAEFPRIVFGEETVPRMLGVSVRTGPNDNANQRSKKTKEALKNPDSSVGGSRISTGNNSPYAIEILVKQGANYIARPASQDAKRRPFVAIGNQELYAVRLINNSPHEAAVNLSIDGINCFHFSEAKLTYWIVPAKSSILVKGWHKSPSKSIEFKVSHYSDTAAAKLKLKPSVSIGQISAAFSASWSNVEDKPRDESSGRGTGFGNEIQTNTKQVRRFIGHLRDSIIVRYER